MKNKCRANSSSAVNQSISTDVEVPAWPPPGKISYGNSLTKQGTRPEIK